LPRGVGQRFEHEHVLSPRVELRLARGFDHVAAGPLVRSSYHADQHVPQSEPGQGPLAAVAAS